MRDFVKIYATILDSSVWGESKDVKLLWITMLAMGGEHGLVEASLGGLARRAGLTREECEAALAVLEAPDPDDKSGVDEGRRIQKTDGGWFITNHRYYRDFRSEKQLKGAERARNFRAREKSKDDALSVTPVTPGNAPSRLVRPDREREGDSERDLPTGKVVAKDLPGSARGGTPATPATPVETEHQATEPKLTMCPLDLLEKAEAVGIVRDFVERYRVEPEQIRDGIREFVAHWTIGGGMGRKDANWPRKLRADLKFKCETPGKLKPVGAIEHSSNTRERRQQQREDNAGLALMREAEALAAGRVAPARRAPAPVKAPPTGAIITDLSKALGGRV